MGTSYINYELNNCTCKRLSGLYTFDDKTPVSADSILTIYFNGQKAFISDIINKDHRSVEIDVTIPENVKQIAF